jgi:hypothetical protein
MLMILPRSSPSLRVSSMCFPTSLKVTLRESQIDTRTKSKRDSPSKREARAKVDLKDLLPVIVREDLGLVPPLDSTTVDKDVDLSGPLAGDLGNDGLDGLLGREIGNENARLASELDDGVPGLGVLL